MEKFKTFFASGWGSASSLIAALVLLASGASALDTLRPWTPAFKGYVDEKLLKVGDDLQSIVTPIRRSQLNSDLRGIKQQNVDMRGSLLQLEALLAETAEPGKRDALRQQIDTLKNLIADIDDQLKQTTCELDILNGRDRCE